MKKPDSELIKQVYNAQKLMPVRNDWCLQIQQDLKDTEIYLSEKEIASTKKSTFKTVVKKQVRELATKYLISKRENPSKSKYLRVGDSMKQYLKTDKLSTEEKILLFQLRTYTFDCKVNFAFKFGENVNCNFCSQKDDQIHLLTCTKLTSGVNISNIKYEDLFGNIEEQICFAKVMKQIVENRKKVLENSSQSGSQVHHA